MQAEYQSHESPIATIEGSYSYTESGRRMVRSNRANRVPSEYFRYRVVKRFCDVVLVLISLPVLLPILGIVSALVMLNSPGPVFYSHRRIRKGGAFFSMWKFRTMCVNSADIPKHGESGTGLISCGMIRELRRSARSCAGTAWMSCRSFGMC